ncbi:MAG: FtsH protease activity modulator HflK [Acetivibrionales bacterium]|jgi:membrane protease subunit HflK
MKKIGLRLLLLIVVMLVGFWCLTGIYTLKSDGGEKAVLTQFGQYVDTIEEAGLHWHIPYPIQKVEIVKTETLRTIELGFRTQNVGDSKSISTFDEVPQEALMITGDENLVNAETVIQYRISNVKDFVFNVNDVFNTLKMASESSVRRVVANHRLDDVLTDQKDIIQYEIKEDLQNICNEYQMGISIKNVALQMVYAPVEVEDAFNDVIKAREDMNRYINEANKEANEIVPAAEATVQEILNEAIAYKEKRIAEAKGDVENFKQVYRNYELGPDVTRIRMYLETMQEILPKAKIYIMNDSGNTLRFLPLEGGAINVGQ